MNKETALHPMLKTVLKNIIELLNLKAGWIWIMQKNGTFYLAASHNLPNNFKNSPDRLSGRCYCIEKYFLEKDGKAENISELVCSCLKKLPAKTYNLKFHANIPIYVNNHKIGLVNVVGKDSQRISKRDLYILGIIGRLIGTGIQRTRIQPKQMGPSETKLALQDFFQCVIQPKAREMEEQLGQIKKGILHNDTDALQKLNTIEDIIDSISRQLDHIVKEYPVCQKIRRSNNQIYNLLLTKRELDVLTPIQKGYTNKEIAESLFISERTVKFHLSSIFQKLSAKNRTEAVYIAQNKGLIKAL